MLSRLNALSSKFSNLSNLINRMVTEKKKDGNNYHLSFVQVSTIFIINRKHLLLASCVWGIVLNRSKACFPPFLKVGLHGGRTEGLPSLRGRDVGMTEVDSTERLDPDLDGHISQNFAYTVLCYIKYS